MPEWKVANLDVRALEPPEPLQRILARLATLESRQYLLIRHRREPFPLYAMLAEQGLCVRIKAPTAGDVRLLVWRYDDGEPPIAKEGWNEV